MYPLMKVKTIPGEGNTETYRLCQIFLIIGYYLRYFWRSRFWWIVGGRLMNLVICVLKTERISCCKNLHLEVVPLFLLLLQLFTTLENLSLDSVSTFTPKVLELNSKIYNKYFSYLKLLHVLYLPSHVLLTHRTYVICQILDNAQ